MLLNSYSRVKPQFRLIVVGDSVRGDLIHERPEFVDFRGWLTGDELANLYRTCDVLIVPSRWEGFGLVAIEAMARGKPVFASNVGGLADIVQHRKTGWLFDLSQIDDVLRDLDALSNDTLEEMGRCGRKLFDRQFTATRMSNHIIEVYESVLTQ